MVLPRVLTSVVLAPLILISVWVGSLPFFLLVAAVCLLSFWEFSLIATEGGYPNQLGVGLLGVILICLAFFLDGATPWGPLHRSPSTLFIFLLWVFLVFLREFFQADKGHSFLRMGTTITGVVITGLFMGHLMILRDVRLVEGEGFKFVGRELTFFLILIIWSVDIGAWAVGRAMGKNPLSPVISPKKSWEGAVGGTFIACAVGFVFKEAFLKNEFGHFEILFYSFVVAVLAQMSDLTESLIKRSFGAKNSSEILPGHGGFFDRFDSFIFTAPFFYYLLLGTGRFQ